MKWLKRNLVTIILILIGLVGGGLIAYPTFADWWNSFHQSRAVAAYAEAVANLDADTYAAIIAEAEDYNLRHMAEGNLFTLSPDQEAEYNSILAIDSSGIMGYIDIPKIDVKLPIYHGTDESVLQVAIGHLAGTSFPVGGEGSHCVLSGHRGLPSARLFTDIVKLVEGDTFTLTVLDQTYSYQVDQIRIVLPTDLSDLSIDPQQDYCTLVTCTPYGVNSHRLLVRGHRIDNIEGEDVAILPGAIRIPTYIVIPTVGIPLLFVFLAGMLIYYRRRRPRYEEDQLEAQYAAMFTKPKDDGGKPEAR